MKRIYAKHLPYTDGHLGKVALDMEHAGAPTIRCMQIGEDFYALEGSHRLACAHRFGLEPKLVVHEPELNTDRDGYWLRVSQTLPAYDFPHVHVLKLGEFEK